MTPNEVMDAIEQICASLPDRLTGNEGTPIIVQALRPVVVNDRYALLAALREYLAWRVPEPDRKPTDAIGHARLWLALQLAEAFALNELRPDIESLIEDVRSGEVLLPVYEAMIVRYLERLVAK